MITLGELLGELVSELAEARQIADALSVTMSQNYHADNFLKSMPVPHYTIDEAEITLPLSVGGIRETGTDPVAWSKKVQKAVSLKLPVLLLQQFSEAYLKKQDSLREKEEEESIARSMLTEPSGDSAKLLKNQKPEAQELPKELQQQYKNLAMKISELVTKDVKAYLKVANLQTLKIIDLRDRLQTSLKKHAQETFANLDAEKKPVDKEEALWRMVRLVGKQMLLEFCQDMEYDRGILVEPCTGKINNYTRDGQLLTIKLKVKEQDLDLVVGNGENGTERFLSLS